MVTRLRVARIYFSPVPLHPSTRRRGDIPPMSVAAVLTVRLDLPEAGYRDAPAVFRFTDQLLERVRALPGVVSAASVDSLPLGGSDSSTGYTFEDFPQPP